MSSELGVSLVFASSVIVAHIEFKLLNDVWSIISRTILVMGRSGSQNK
jgi:hypothetical protein